VQRLTTTINLTVRIFSSNLSKRFKTPVAYSPSPSPNLFQPALRRWLYSDAIYVVVATPNWFHGKFSVVWRNNVPTGQEIWELYSVKFAYNEWSNRKLIYVTICCCMSKCHYIRTCNRGECGTPVSKGRVCNLCTRGTVLQRKRFRIVFGRFSFRISVGSLTVLTEVFRGFP
jgi:hypothetical protein